MMLRLRPHALLLFAATLSVLALGALAAALLGVSREEPSTPAASPVASSSQPLPVAAFESLVRRPQGQECRTDPAKLPPPPPQADGRPATYYHTCRAALLDSSGNAVRITGVSWFGMETGTYAPHGLWTRNWSEMLDQIAALGFNTVRLPFSNDALREGQMPQSINYDLNPDLKGKSSLEIMDAIVAGAGERGLKVILDRHRPTAEGQSELWYTDTVSEERWIQDWVMLARRYRNVPTVLGVDLHNEPRGPATWGDGNLSTDWQLAAQRAGNAVLEANPYLLVFVQGVERDGDDWYWWGGNLRGVREHPVQLDVPGRVVYSPHDYGPGVYLQGWFKAPDFPRNLPSVWDAHWGYIANQGLAPVVLGEFGGQSVGKDAEGQWQRALLDYAKKHDVSWISWSLNPNSSDTGGLLGDDWRTVVGQKASLYQAYTAAPLSVGTSGVFGQPKGRLLVRARNSDTSDRGNQISLTLQVANDASASVDLHDLELRYWFRPGNLGDVTEQAEVDYATAGKDNTLPRIVATGGNGLAYLSLRFSPAAGAIQPYGSSEVVVRVHKSDWSGYSQSSDFSFKSDGQLGDWDRVALYRAGRRVWGKEPGDDSNEPSPATRSSG